MAFWTDTPTVDPKRDFRFRVRIGAIDNGFIWYAKTATKPEISITEADHKYINHTYYWPARTEWNDVEITFVDPVRPDLAGRMAESLRRAGYDIPVNADAGSQNWGSMSKLGAMNALGQVTIAQIDENGEWIEKWTLHHPWIKKVAFGKLDYGSDSLTEMTMTFRYDWAEFEAGGISGRHEWMGPGGGGVGIDIGIDVDIEFP